jgi:hypothetical protein
MNRKDEERNLNRAIEEIRGESIDPAALGAAAERVRLQIGAAKARTQGEACDEFRTLFPGYLRGELPGSRTLLLEDHIRGCVGCRKALQEARSPRAVPAAGADRASPSRGATPVRWAIAAIVVFGLGLTAFALRDRLLPSSFDATAQVLSAEGGLYRVAGEAIQPLAAGDTVKEGVAIRTPGDSGAVVRLADGSQVEMRERSEMSLSRLRDGVAVELASGSVIVQAAPQGAGHLYVSTDDCVVSVTGTIFAVNHGIKGSRVSVVEGSVNVRFDGAENDLEPGEQVATSAALGRTPVEAEIAWSQNLDRYLALLHELRALQKSLDENVLQPGLRHSTRLLDLAPEGTVFYAAIPNVSASLAETRRLLREKVENSDVLRQWWENKVAPLGGDSVVDRVLERMRNFGDQLGDEIVVTLQKDETGEVRGPFVLAEIKNQVALRSVLEEEIGRVDLSSEGRPSVRILDDAQVLGSARPAGDLRQAMLFWLHDDVLVASPDLSAVRASAGRLATEATGAFGGSSFHDRLADAYRDGAGWLFGVDLEAILDATAQHAQRKGDAEGVEKLRRLGVLDAKHLIVEAQEDGGQVHDRAVLTFDGPRHGVAAWLANPAPMAGLEFVSPDATIAGAFLVKDPTTLIEEVYGLARLSASDFDRHLEEFRSKTGVDLVRDVAAPLGGEFVFAVDGPILPVPSWKLVLGVNDPARLQQTLERLVDQANRSLEPGESGLAIGRTEIGGRTFFTLRSDQLSFEIHYVFVDGYFIAAPQRALLDRALQQRQSGYTLPASPKFTALLPRDAEPNFSAVLYQNIASALQPLAQGLIPSQRPLTPDQKRSIDALAVDSPAGIAYAYAENDRVVFAGEHNGGIVSGLGSVLGFDGRMELHDLLSTIRAEREESTTP